MAKLSILGEVVCIALCMSVILWQETSSSSLGPYSATVTQGTTTSGGSVCNEMCTRIYSPVCGSDGKTYSNECGLRVTACKSNTSITKLYTGSCNNNFNCGGITCPPGKACELNAEGQQVCVCSGVCTMQYDPVCGSDGRTYGSDCQVRLAACDSNTNITVLHKGSCADETPSSSLGPGAAIVTQATTTNGGSACNDTTCPRGKSCAPDGAGQSSCVCNTMCPDNYDPVCGSDGETYSNDCDLIVKACVTETNITVAQKGQCEEVKSATTASASSIQPGHPKKKPNCRGKKQKGC